MIQNLTVLNKQIKKKSLYFLAFNCSSQDIPKFDQQ